MKDSFKDILLFVGLFFLVLLSIILPTLFHPHFAYTLSLLLFTISYFIFVLARVLKRKQTRLEASETFFRNTLEDAGIGVALVSLEGAWFMVNKALCTMLGYTKKEIEKLSAIDIYHPDDLHNIQKKFKKLEIGITKIFSTDTRCLCKNKQTIWVHISVSVLSHQDGTPKYFIEYVGDISKTKKLESMNVALTNLLQDEKEHLKLLLASIVDCVIATDHQGNITFMNSEAEIATEWSFIEAIGLQSELVFQLDGVGENPIMHCLKYGKSVHSSQDAILINKSGVQYNIQYAISFLQAQDNSVIGTEIVFQNITEAKNLQKELSYNASHDALTGLINRREFERVLNRMRKEPTLSVKQSILCYLDLDYFKIINDSVGHAAGDALLREIADLLNHHLRKADILARLGGDEFGIILTNCPLNSGKLVAQKMIDLVNAIRFRWDDKVFRIGMSIGMVVLDDDSLTADRLLAEADVACYSAKAEGRNRVFIYQLDHIESLEHHRDILMASTVQEAIDENRLILFAQKIASTKNHMNDTQNFEILIRMCNTKNEIIEAGKFVHTAERFNLMTKVDRWVLTQMLKHYDKALSKIENAHFSINLSANSLNDPHFLEFITALVKKSALPAERLCFEITETAAMNHVSKTILIVKELQKLGCKIALDDFGSGLSSFSYVKNFRVNYIKIDGSFVKNLLTHKVDSIIVQTINDMTHRLGMQTIAEFVENKAILEAISIMGVDYAQGYEIGKPTPLGSLFELE